MNNRLRNVASRARHTLKLLLIYLAPTQLVFAADPLSGLIIPGFSWLYFAKLAFALVAVLVFFLLFAWVLRRSHLPGKLQSSDLNIVASLSLGTRERLVVIQAGEKQVLLGITPTQINSLTVLDTPLQMAGSHEDTSFRSTLDSLLGKSTA